MEVSSTKKPNNSDGQLSIVSVLCRICYDDNKDESLIAPCQCKGTVAFVHRTCLERWLAESNTTRCELCHVIFKTERTPRYTTKQAIWRWLRSNQISNNGYHGVRGDLIACTIITPLAILVTYVCLLSSDYYNQKKFVTVPAARWTSISLLIMIGIMLIGYYLWVYSVMRYHSRMWFNWWQRECIVRYIPPTNYQIVVDDENDDEIMNPCNTPDSEQSSSSTPTTTQSTNIVLNIINDDIFEHTINTVEDQQNQDVKESAV